ncbi:hypothetical protein LBMAG44_07540 [Gemmatimonadota bacterium]|nr:hypothetical protein LBMAG44_07540 [Gemmatimonadota bacterium]
MELPPIQELSETTATPFVRPGLLSFGPSAFISHVPDEPDVPDAEPLLPLSKEDQLAGLLSAVDQLCAVNDDLYDMKSVLEEQTRVLDDLQNRVLDVMFALERNSK